MRLRTHPVLRLALVADLVVFAVVLAIVAWLPVSDDPPGAGWAVGSNVLRPGELIVIVLAPFVVVGLLGRMLERPHVPGNEWAYAVTIFYAVASLSLLALPQGEPVPRVLIVALACLILPSIAGAIAGHLLDGGSKRLAPRIAYRIDRDPR